MGQLQQWGIQVKNREKLPNKQALTQAQHWAQSEGGQSLG